MKKVLITGAAGFAGGHIVQYIHDHTDWQIVCMDRLNYSSTLERLARWREDSRVSFVYHDFRAAVPERVVMSLQGVTHIIHNGAESHVGRSLTEPETFVQSNVVGTLHLLELARKLHVERFLYTSTDEVTGSTPEGESFKEDSPIRPSNPYSAAKAGGEALVHAYWRSFQVPVITTRCQNMFGEMQHPEKFVPLCISRVWRGEKLTVHSDTTGKSGSRMWIHARNEASAVLFLLQQDERVVGQTYNIAGEALSNMEMAETIAVMLNKPLHADLVPPPHPGHDLHYIIDDAKIHSLGWEPIEGFSESLRQTVEWYVRPENVAWLG